MRLRPFFPYYGSKWRIAPLYPRPLYRSIIEPFAGSAQYATLYHQRDVLLVDADEVICGVWDYLIRVQPNEILGLPDPGPLQALDELGLCQEARWLIGFWVGPATTYPARRPSSWYAKWHGNGARVWGDEVRRRLACQVERIRHWRVKHAPYEDIHVAGNATWFIDPPYAGRQGTKYRHSSAHIDYERLGQWCRERTGQTIVCEGEGAVWLPFEPVAISTSTRKKAVVEKVWTSGCVTQQRLWEAS